MWGTFQDRLVSELRLAGVGTIAEANRFLAGFLRRYNARFAVTPAVPGSAYRPASDRPTAEELFCFKHRRAVGLDNVVRFQGHRLQVLPSMGRFSYARCHVEVHEALIGTLQVYYQGRYLDTCPAPAEATRARELAAVSTTEPEAKPGNTRPAADHPWRRRLLPLRH